MTVYKVSLRPVFSRHYVANVGVVARATGLTIRAKGYQTKGLTRFHWRCVLISLPPWIEWYTAVKVGPFPTQGSSSVRRGRSKPGQPIRGCRVFTQVKPHGFQSALEQLDLGLRGLHLSCINSGKQSRAYQAGKQTDQNQYDQHLDQGKTTLWRCFVGGAMAAIVAGSFVNTHQNLISVKLVIAKTTPIIIVPSTKPMNKMLSGSIKVTTRR
jgi:hypothetical protein